jgi:vacuolar-type H+-ATPase subunit I/STV1
MSILESNAARVRNLSATELYLYILAHGLLGIGLGAFAARMFASFAPLLVVGGIVVGLILIIVSGRRMFVRSMPK